MKRTFGKTALFAALVTLLLAGLLALGCGNVFDPPAAGKGVPPGHGILSLAINGAARTIQPDAGQFGAYKLDFFDAESDSLVKSVTWTGQASGNVVLLFGAYTLTVTAYPTGDTGLETPVAEGTSEPFTVTAAGASASVSLFLIEEATGTGTFAWDIAIGSAVTKVTMTIAALGGGGSPLSLTLFESGGTTDKPLTGTDASQDLAAGAYAVVFTLTVSDPSEPFLWPETLYIYPNLTSTFATAEFADGLFDRTDPAAFAIAELIKAVKKEIQWNAINNFYFTAAGIAGVDADNYDTITEETDNYYGVATVTAGSKEPADLADLKALTDIALIYAGYVKDPGYDSEEQRQAAINGYIKNASAIGAFSWSGVDSSGNNIVTFTVGRYKVKLVFLDMVFALRLQLANLIVEAQGLADDVTDSATDAADVPRGDFFTLQADIDDLQTAIDDATAVHEDDPAADQAALEEAIADLQAAVDTFNGLKSKSVGTKPPDVDGIEAKLSTLEGLMTNTKVETDTNNIPGLFLDFDVYWVTVAEDTALAAAANAAITDAENFIASIATAGTKGEADAIEAALQAAIDGYNNTKKEGLGLVFVQVPKGSFNRWSVGTSITNGTSAGTASNITYNYKIAKYELTIGQWEAVMGFDPTVSWKPGASNKPGASGHISTTVTTEADKKKVAMHRVSFYDALAFCNRLSYLTGKTMVYTTPYDTANSANPDRYGGNTISGFPQLFLASNGASGTSTRATIPGVYGNGAGVSNGSGDIHATDDTEWNDTTTVSWIANGFRLPTVWEWQWAAMGANKDSTNPSNTSPNNTGYKKMFAGANAVNDTGTLIPSVAGDGRSDYAWYGLNDSNAAWPTGTAPNGAYPVGLKKANELGLHDMSGNVAEWCWDKTAVTTNNGSLDTISGSDWRGTSAAGQRRLGKGGEWRNAVVGTTNWRSSPWNNTGFLPKIGQGDLGFRLVVDGSSNNTETLP